MNIYDAIMKAADHIDRTPGAWRWFNCDIPLDCGTPACALGWIGFYLGLGVKGEYGIKPGIWKAWEALGLSGSDQFYDRMNNIGTKFWRESTAMTANNLRLYAAKYHAPAHTGLPDSVREIFTNPRQTISDTAVDQKFA